MIASDYPFLDLFWTMLIFFVWVSWLMLLFRVIADIFRRHDIGGGAKALWLLFVIFLPFLGVLVYLIAHSRDMAERTVTQAAADQRQVDDYVRSVAASGGAAAEIEKAKQLLDSGAISQEEYEQLKQRAMA